jgi:acetyl-CoA carboxylase biotin carboxyl carrier protein
VDRERILEIIRLAQELPVAELGIREGDLEVRVVKGGAIPAAAPEAPGEAPPSTELVRAESQVTVRATKVGFFHRGKGPGAAPLVAAGDRVQAGQPLACLESLRKLTDVTADIAGEIAAVLAEDGSAVEYGQALFEIRPDQGAAHDGSP